MPVLFLRPKTALNFAPRTQPKEGLLSRGVFTLERRTAVEVKIRPTKMDDVRPMMDLYLRTLSGVVDDFWEEHILNAQFYEIDGDENQLGFFTIYGSEKITQLYLIDSCLNLAQPVFQRVLKEYEVKTAFAATCDELFLSLCLDFHRKVELQACFFDGTAENAVREPEFDRSCLFRIPARELETVKALTGDFFDFVTEKDLQAGSIELYRLRKDGETLGFGIYRPNRLVTRCASIGMITMEPYRRRGVGRSLQLHLADLCRERGLIPVSGCWYCNRNSKRTIESAGRYSRTRLLNILF